MQKIAEVLYHAYETSRMKKVLAPKGYDEAFENFYEMLNDEQKKAYRDFEFLDLELNIAQETDAILFILELLHPELVQ